MCSTSFYPICQRTSNLRSTEFLQISWKLAAGQTCKSQMSVATMQIICLFWEAPEYGCWMDPRNFFSWWGWLNSGPGAKRGYGIFLEVFKTQLGRALNSLVWIHCWSCFEEGLGLETSWCRFPPRRFFDHGHQVERGGEQVGMMHSNIISLLFDDVCKMLHSSV